MRAKEYLQQLKRLDTVINQKKMELRDLRIMAQGLSSIDYSKDRVQTSSAGDAQFVKILNNIVDLDEEINFEINRFIEKKHEIINKIISMENAKYIEILYKRYVELKHLEAIAVEMNYTYQYTRELHGYALQEFEKTLM